MNKKVIFCTAQPDDQYFIWQNHLYVESCLQQGIEEEQIHILLYKPTYRQYNTNWEKLKEFYPKLNIFVYEDKGVQQHLGIYIPILRPHILWQHFEAFPELQDKTIVYTDCDILWTDRMNISHLLEDGINYVSDAASYLNHSYFESKKKDALQDRISEYEERDFLAEICNIVGIKKSVAVENNSNTGGVQYILKNVDAAFWKKVEGDVLKIRKHLLQANKDFFKDENAGIQSWCADLWAVQFNLWFHNRETKVTPELNFAWAPDPLVKLDSHPILHNAGITGTETAFPCFYKGKYHQGTSPFTDPYLDEVLNHDVSKNYCTWYYANKLDELRKKYKINY